MVSGNGTQSSSLSTPRLTSRRTTRVTSRAFTSSLVPKNIGRPPIILEWGSTVLRVGFAGQCQPQHIIPLPREPFERLHDNEAKKLHPNFVAEEESRWYECLSPIIQNVFDHLMVVPTARRVVVLARPYPLRVWETAMKETLWNIGVPAISFLNYLEVVPVVLGWNRGLAVHVGIKESQCLAHVDGHTLPYTYQVVPCGYRAVVEDDRKVQCIWTETMEKIWLDENNPHSLLVALLKCLDACPRDTRKDVISNLSFCGNTLMAVPDLGRRLALKLKTVLDGNSGTKEEGGLMPIAGEQECSLTYVPVDLAALKSLADHVGLLSCAPIRPDLIPWTGASLFSTIQHRHEDDVQMKWFFDPFKTAE